MATRSFRWAWVGACVLLGACASGAAGDRSTSRPEVAAQQATSGAPVAERGASREGASGVVEGRAELDRANNLVVAGSEGEGLAFERFKIDDRTEVTIDGQQASMAQVNAGDEVRAAYSGTPDALHVDRLEVVREGEAAQGQQR